MEKPILLQQQQQQSTQLQPQATIAPATSQYQQISQQPRQPRHILFDLTPLDIETEDIDEKTKQCYNTVKQMISGKSPKECHDIYQQFIALNPQQNTDTLTVGLLIAILVEQNGQSDFYRDIVMFSKDNLALFSHYLNMIIIERITRISHHSVKQIFWLANQLIKGGTLAAENTCSNLVRQTAKGDTSPRNLFMVENLLDLLIENRSWLINSGSFVGPTVVYNVTRLIMDHLAPAHEAIRAREVKFVIGLVREKFDFIHAIGKDFLRLLGNLHNRIPEFKQLYQDIYEKEPKAFHPSYEGPKQLMSLRTPRRLFQSCLTFDMERKISYLATQVRFGNQKRYQDWFQKQYLSGPETATLRSDLIRYICTIIHPSNEVLCSDIIPRWAIIGWLLTVQCNVQMCRQALFFDWFAFDPKSDNIMNIEPAILLMFYSLRSHPQVTASLLDYLCGAHLTVNQSITAHVKACIKKSLQQILEKRVLPTLVSLFVNPKHEPALKERIRESFPEFCQVDNGTSKQNHSSSKPATVSSAAPATQIDQNSTEPTKQNQLEVVSLDDNPFGELGPSSATQDICKGKAEGTVPLLGFQQPQKILVPPVNQSNKPAVRAKSDPKSQPGTNMNGTDPIEALINVGKSAPQAADSKTNPVNSSAPPKRAVTAETKQETLEDDNTNACSVSKRLADIPAIGNNIQPYHGCDSNNASNENSYDLSLDPVDNDMLIDVVEHNPHIKVAYSFMTVKRVLPDDLADSFGEQITSKLNYLHKDTVAQVRVAHMQQLVESLEKGEVDSDIIDDLGCHIANLISEDFEERIHASLLQDLSIHKAHEISPLFVLGSHFSTNEQPKPSCSALFAAIANCFEAAGFLMLYYLRCKYFLSKSAHQIICSHLLDSNSEQPLIPKVCQVCSNGNTGILMTKTYHALCEAQKMSDPTKSLVKDMKLMLTYDCEMFCFMLPCIFSEFAHSDLYSVINNSELIRMVTSAVDPTSLQEFMCLCLTGSAKIISREDPMSAIESSLTWESWEQYCFWKILTAQSVPVENYISILSKLNSKANPEAVSSILLNLQKISEPDVNILQNVIDTYNRQNDQFVTAVIRYWSIRSDLKVMTKNIISLFDSRPTSPQMKRKGQAKTTAAKSGTSASPSSTTSSSSSSTTLSTRSEKLLLVLDSIRRRAPRNKLLAQAEILDTLTHLEPMCNESQRAKLNQLIQSRPKPTKKKKLDKD